MSWRRVAALAVPLAVVFFVLGFVAGMEVRRGPNWRLELDEYVEAHRRPGEVVRLVEVRRARRPQDFTLGMGAPVGDADITPTFPPQAVRCALLGWSTPGDDGTVERQQVVYVVRYSDALYRVGWTVYLGAEEPFGPAVRADLENIRCDVELE